MKRVNLVAAPPRFGELFLLRCQILNALRRRLIAGSQMGWGLYTLVESLARWLVSDRTESRACSRILEAHEASRTQTGITTLVAGIGDRLMGWCMIELNWAGEDPVIREGSGRWREGEKI